MTIEETKLGVVESDQYGFTWGPMEVERSCHIEGVGYLLTIRTKYREMDVYVSEKGMRIEPKEVLKR